MVAGHHSHTTDNFCKSLSSTSTSTVTASTISTTTTTSTATKDTLNHKASKGTTTSTSATGTKPSPKVSTNDKVFLKFRNGSICAVGTVLREQTVIHGQPVRKGNLVISIEDVVQVGAKTWYPDKFGEDDLLKGAIFEWPVDTTTTTGDLSPLHTWSKKRI